MLRNQFRKQHCKNTALPEHLNYRGLLRITTTNLIVFNLGIGETSVRVCAKSLVKISQRNFVEIDVQLLLEFIEILLLGLGWKWDELTCIVLSLLMLHRILFGLWIAERRHKIISYWKAGIWRVIWLVNQRPNNQPLFVKNMSTAIISI